MSGTYLIFRFVLKALLGRSFWRQFLTKSYCVQVFFICLHTDYAHNWTVVAYSAHTTLNLSVIPSRVNESTLFKIIAE